MKQIKRHGWRQTAVSLPIRSALLCAGGFATVPAAARRCDLESGCAVPCERSRKSLRTITPLCARWSSRLGLSPNRFSRRGRSRLSSCTCSLSTANFVDTEAFGDVIWLCPLGSPRVETLRQKCSTPAFHFRIDVSGAAQDPDFAQLRLLFTREMFERAPAEDLGAFVALEHLNMRDQGRIKNRCPAWLHQELGGVESSFLGELAPHT